MVDASSNPYRLPRTVVPRRYELRLEPDLDRLLTAAGTKRGKRTSQTQADDLIDFLGLGR